MKKKHFLRILLVPLLAAALITTVYAYMFHKSETVSNVFIPAEVTCLIDETFDGETKSVIRVTNTGNVDAYIRVRLVFHWQDSKGNTVARDFSAAHAVITYDSDLWIKDADDGYTYYYKEAVAPGKSTPNLLTDAGITLASVTETDDNGVRYTYYPVVEVLAEAIQRNPAEAENTAWNVLGSN